MSLLRVKKVKNFRTRGNECLKLTESRDYWEKHGVELIRAKSHSFLYFLHLSLTHTHKSKDFVLFCSEGFHGISSKAALVKLNFHLAIF